MILSYSFGDWEVHYPGASVWLGILLCCPQAEGRTVQMTHA